MCACLTSGGKLPGSPGRPSLAQCQTPETNQIIAPTTFQTAVPEENNTKANKRHAERTPHSHVSKRASTPASRRENVAKVSEVGLQSAGNTSVENDTHPCLRTPVTGKPHTWASHPRRGSLQHSTMGSSLDCYSRAISVSQTIFWQATCRPFFYPYHRQTSPPSPRTHASLCHKTITFEGAVTRLRSFG